LPFLVIPASERGEPYVKDRPPLKALIPAPFAGIDDKKGKFRSRDLPALAACGQNGCAL